MQIGIGLPNSIPGAPGRRLVEWAVRAEERGFSALATIDRVAYPTHDTLATLAAAAGATSRIGLLSNILLAPLYSAPLLAKAAATLAGVSDGRFTLGMAPGGREDDYTTLGRDFHTRGKDFDATLGTIHAAWRGEPVPGADHLICDPVKGGRVPVLIGGASDPAYERTAKWGAGWASGGVPPDAAAGMVQKVREAWTAAGREGEPRLAALAYFSLGDDATESSLDYLRGYYGFLGNFGEMIAQGALRSEEAISGAVAGFRDAGITELYLDPTTFSLGQIDRLADVVLV